MGLSPDQLNALDEWILDYLGAHEWASPNHLRVKHGAAHDDERKSRQWISDRVRRLEEHNHIERVHPDVADRQLVSDPRDAHEETEQP
jgi:hypothetical protein